jgi:hypothetical protein
MASNFPIRSGSLLAPRAASRRSSICRCPPVTCSDSTKHRSPNWSSVRALSRGTTSSLHQCPPVLIPSGGSPPDACQGSIRMLHTISRSIRGSESELVGERGFKLVDPTRYRRAGSRECPTLDGGAPLGRLQPSTVGTIASQATTLIPDQGGCLYVFAD